MHPIAYKLPALDYLPLVRTYLLLDCLYYLDLPLTCGRVRLTRMSTGTYVIYGNHGNIKDRLPEEYLGNDELLHMNVPYGMLRVMTSPGEFHALHLPEEIVSLSMRRCWAMRPVYNKMGKLGYEMKQVSKDLIDLMRQEQLELLLTGST